MSASPFGAALGFAGELAGAAGDSGSAAASQTFGSQTGAVIGSRPWTTTEKTIAAGALVLVVAIAAVVYLKRKKG